MATFEVTIENITVHPHPNADRLEFAQVGLYNVVVPKGKYVTGDEVFYIPEFSVLPESLITTLGLEGKLAGSKANRVKPVKLRGLLSQGLVAPLTVLDEIDREIQDFSEALDITKWEPIIPASLAGDVTSAPQLIRWIEIENIKKFPDMFKEGEHVVIDEKVHGCLAHNTKILMPDYSTRTIRDLVESNYRGEVLGMDANGAITPVKVTNTFNNGQSETWVKINVKRHNVGRGAADERVFATPNHRFYSPYSDHADEEGYVKAENLKVGDKVTIHRYDFQLTPLDEQILIGKMLGDGTLTSTNGLTSSLNWGQKDEEYADYALGLLSSSIQASSRGEAVSGHGTRMHRRGTTYNAKIFDLFKDWFKDGKKVVPLSVISKINPIALAFWYMDDGSLGFTEGQEDRALIATNGFDEDSISSLVLSLERFGIHPVPYNAGDGWRLRFNADEAEKLFLIIAPYISKSNAYKLPKRYRKLAGSFTIDNEGKYKPETRELEVTEVLVTDKTWTENPSNPRSVRVPRYAYTRYDLETESHNFFANNILVHNSCTCVTVINPTSEDAAVFVTSKGVGSRNLSLKETANNAYWRMFHKFNIKDFTAFIGNKFSDATKVAVFGETYGSVQDLHYGLNNELGFILFDIQIHRETGEKEWLAPEVTEALAKEFGMPMAPRLYDGPYSIEVVTKLAYGPELVSGTEANIREGVVVRPAADNEDIVFNGGRKIGKFVSDDYLTRRGGTEYN